MQIKQITRLRHLAFFLVISLLLPACTYLFFQPDDIDYSKYWVKEPEIAEIKITASDGYEMTHWLLKADTQAAKNAKGTIFFLHGNGQNNSAYVPLVYWMTEHGYHVFMFEYRGYGNNFVKPSLEHTIGDVEAALDYLLSQAQYSPVSLYGQSLGGSIAGFVAANYKQKSAICSVVLEAPFSDYRDIVREKLALSWLTWPLQYPLSWLVDNRYSPIDSIHKVMPTPLMLLHSHADRVVPYSHGKRLYASAKEPKHFLSVNGFHIQAMANPQVQFSLLQFFDEQGC